MQRFRGLMLHNKLEQRQGLLLVENRDSKLETSIHMFFMKFDLAVIWINSHLQVVDVRHALPWQAMLVPAQPARYILETHPANLERFHVGDTIVIKHE